MEEIELPVNLYEESAPDSDKNAEKGKPSFLVSSYPADSVGLAKHHLTAD